MKIRVDFPALLVTIIVLYCNGGMLAFLKGSLTTTILIYGTLLLWLALAIIKDREFVLTYISVCSFVFVFFVLLNLFMFVLDSSVINMMSRMRKNIMFLLMFAAIFIYYSAPERRIGRRTILFAWGFDTVIASIYTIYRLVEMPTLSRILATESPEAYLGDGISIAGVFGFGSIYGLVFIVTVIIGTIKKVKHMHKVVMICCVVLFVYTIIQAQFFIASVLCVIGIIMGVFWGGKVTVKRIIIFSAFLPLVILVLSFIVNEVLPALALSGALPQFISERLLMFLNGISVEELLGTARGVVYLQSFSAIMNSYGIGIMFMNTLSTGGHSEILDLIAVYGIPLAALLVCGIWKLKKFISRSIPADMTRNYNIVWILFLLMSLFNTSLWCQTTVSLFLIIPLTYMELRFNAAEVK